MRRVDATYAKIAQQLGKNGRWFWVTPSCVGPLRTEHFHLLGGSGCDAALVENVLHPLWFLGSTESPELSKEESKKLEKQLKAREDYLLPIFHQVAVQFADLHDTPGRMQEKGVITVKRGSCVLPLYCANPNLKVSCICLSPSFQALDGPS